MSRDPAENPTTRALKEFDYPLLVRIEDHGTASGQGLVHSAEHVLRQLGAELSYVEVLPGTVERPPGSFHEGGAAHCATINVGGQASGSGTLATLRLFSIDRSGLPEFGARENGVVHAKFSPLASDPGTVELVLREWVGYLAPEHSQLRRVEGEEALRRSIEQLLRIVQMQVLENQSLLNQIAERDLVIEQLEGQVQTLLAELRRHDLDARRVHGPVNSIRSIVATALLSGLTSFGGGYGGVVAASGAQASPEPTVVIVEQPSATGDALRAVVEACLDAEQVADSTRDHNNR